MKVTIHHLNWDKCTDREMRLTITCDGQIGAMLIAMIEGKYDHVANVDVKEAVNSDALEVAYMMTQNIDDSWLKNDRVNPSSKVLEAGGCKSSSVGDVFEIAGRFYAVAGCGFEELTLEKAREEKFAA